MEIESIVMSVGLSPRTRGSLQRGPSGRRWHGSIPANAGEPRRSCSRPRGRRVYPRERGGAGARAGKRRRSTGLSPRTRGSRQRKLLHDPPVGSIPANAGEPPRPATCRPPSGVYPRERGGAGMWSAAAGAAAGSIPANAGEPQGHPDRPRRPRVYPRERGGAGQRALLAQLFEGLSPRTRGSHPRNCFQRRRRRSIPANAGEPVQLGAAGHRPQVYPRERGGAGFATPYAAFHEGLSPRTRGSRSAPPANVAMWGSIPANAGEPLGANPMTPKGNHRKRCLCIVKDRDVIV